MTPEQLDEIEKLAVNFKSAAFRDLMARQTLPLVKALREAWSALKWQAAMTKTLSESQERLVNEVKEAQAEVKRQRDEAHSEISRLRVENKFLRERPIPEGRIHQAMTGYVMDLRALVLDHEWVTDGRECVVYCLWCKQIESKGHAEACEMFGPGGLIPIDPKTRRPAPVKSLRERGCQCQWEAGDSACPVHGEEAK